MDGKEVHDETQSSEVILASGADAKNRLAPLAFVIYDEMV